MGLQIGATHRTESADSSSLKMRRADHGTMAFPPIHRTYHIYLFTITSASDMTLNGIPNASDGHAWSPEVLQDILAWLATETPATKEASPATSSSCSAGAYTYASSSFSPTPPYDESVLERSWQQCLLDETIGDFLDTRRYPVSYRALIRMWQKLGSPALRKLRIPLGVRLHGTVCCPNDLRHITDAQERSVIDNVQSFFARGITASQPFASFADHLHIYAAVYAELEALRCGWNQDQEHQSYEQTWRGLLATFVEDRSTCVMQHQPHDCLHRMLWGEVHSWPLAELKQQFATYSIWSASISNTAGAAAASTWDDCHDTVKQAARFSPTLTISATTSDDKYAGLLSETCSASNNNDDDVSLTMQHLSDSLVTTQLCHSVGANMSGAQWMQQYPTMLEEAAKQLSTTAAMLSAKARRLRSCSAATTEKQQHQWQQQLDTAFGRSRSISHF